MITLRGYQEDLFSKIQGAFRRGVKKPLVVLGCGGGKTVLFSAMAARKKKAARIMITVHRKELLGQVSRTLKQFGADHGIISPDHRYEPLKDVQVGMIQTIGNRIRDIVPPTLIVGDEIHHCLAASHLKVYEYWKHAFFVGFTASPLRFDNRGLGAVFEEILEGPSVQWLVDNGHLCQTKYYAPEIIADLSQVKTRAGDFAQNEVAAAMDKSVITGDAVYWYGKLCGGQPAIAFCASIEHAKHVSEQFCAGGYRSAVIHSKQTNEEREDAVLALGDGRIHVLTSVDIISEGFDVPKVTAAILLRPTKSLGLHIQQLGRCKRVFEGKEWGYVIDHCGNLDRHGLAEDDREWSLDDAKKKCGSGAMNGKRCKLCFAISVTSGSCSNCGAPLNDPRDGGGREALEVVEGNLVEWVRDDRPIAELMKSVEKPADIDIIRRAKGFKPGWAWHQKRAMGFL